MSFGEVQVFLCRVAVLIMSSVQFLVDRVRYMYDFETFPHVCALTKSHTAC
jgi:hypothetical protein